MNVHVEYLPEAAVEIEALEQLPDGQVSERYWSIVYQWARDEQAGFGRRTRCSSFDVETPNGTRTIQYSVYPNTTVGALVGFETQGDQQNVRVAIVRQYDTEHAFSELVEEGKARLIKRIVQHGKL